MARDITKLHPKLQSLIAKLRAECEKQGLKIGIGECLRTVEEQNALYAKGRTAPGNIVTNAEGSNYSSMHQWGVAFDFYRNDGKGAYNNNDGFFNKVGKIGVSIGLEWGGNWKSFVDLPHFQLPNWGSGPSKLKQTYGTPDKFMATWGDGYVPEPDGDSPSGDGLDDPSREWGVDAPSISDESTIELPQFSRKDLEITDDMYLGSEVFRKVRDKMVDCGVGYLIYFDNVLMNRYVVNFSSTISTSGDIETADIELLYTPVFWRSEVRDSKTNLYDSFDSIENQTNVRIFVMNIVTKKFDQVFDGDIKQKRRRKTAKGKTIVYTAKCHLDWFNRISVPVALPLNKTISIGDQLKWLGQGIDLSKIDTVTFLADSHFKGKTLREFLNAQVQKTFLNNYLFKDSNTVAAWDDAVNRICVMGDIDPNLKAAECIDFIVSASTEIVDTMYTTVHRIATSLLIEYFSDRDGLIRIKPPYWNQPVLKDHIIDPMFIISQSDMTNWDGFYTRIIATGGNEEWDQNAGIRGEYVKSDFLTPVGVYVGNMRNSEEAFWADFTGVHLQFSDQDDTTSGYWTTDEKEVDSSKNINRMPGIEWFKNFSIVYDFGKKHHGRAVNGGSETYNYIHTGIDFCVSDGINAESGLPVYALCSGEVTGYKKYNADNMENTQDPLVYLSNDNNRTLYDVTITSSSTKTEIRYCHLDQCYVKMGDEVGLIGDRNVHAMIGRVGIKGHGTYNVWHLSVKQNKKYIDPLIFIDGKDEIVATNEPDTAPTSDALAEYDDGVMLLNNDLSYLNELLIPSNDERKYGPNILEITQNMIKFATSGAVQNSTNPAMALRRYSQFMYYMMNSSINTSQMNIIAMPWLRPGFNVWVDPTDDDTVYYINSISYTGSPESGVNSSLELSLGRYRHIFATEQNAFGSQKNDCDNLLISEFVESQTVDKFGEIIHNNAEFENIKEAAYEFYSSDDEKIIGVESEEYFKNLYGNVNSSPDAPSIVDIQFEDDADELTGECLPSAMNNDSLKALNMYDNYSDKRVLAWPVPTATCISNGYGDNHKAVDIYCGFILPSRPNVFAVCDQYVISINKNASGYIVTCLQDDILGNGNMTMVTYAHIYSINKNLEEAFNAKLAASNAAREREIRNNSWNVASNRKYEKQKRPEDMTKEELSSQGVFINQGSWIGDCSTSLHISFAEKAGGESGNVYMYRDITDYLNIKNVQNKVPYTTIRYNSDFFTDTDSVVDEDPDEVAVSKFCESKKFFSREMSFDEIDKQIQELYSDSNLPPIIKNRVVALAARISEADRFIQRFYDSEDLAMWQDIKKFSQYVAGNSGYQTGEWVDDVYSGITAEQVSVNLTDFNAYKKSTAAIYTTGDTPTNTAEIASEQTVYPDKEITKGGFCYTYLYMNRTENNQSQWGVGQGQKKIYDFWVSEGKPSKDSIATHVDASGSTRYYVATTSKYGKIGQYMDFEIIPQGKNESIWIKCIKMDEKSAGDSNYTVDGHRYKSQISLIEFCVYKKGNLPASNPGQDGWKPEWKLGTIVRCNLLDQNILDEI